ncbi:unnamed protein product [Arctia plantaginis]|uniref:Reverse transcriptase RNase H-like domain-containing protein n=1 Tax=Arctia plantaginis TaxID=874455 RepID=A0A8S0ZTI0_ARCPL|nr:unnamed protein product [Arctia plantaginis]
MEKCKFTFQAKPTIDGKSNYIAITSIVTQEEKLSIKKIADRFVIEKNSSACHWMEVFKTECERFNLIKDEEKIEIFRLFLEKSCTDWYSSMMIKLSLQSEWSEWKPNFLQTYASKGWTTSRYALSFKYQSGSLLEYAIKKEKLLLEVRKTIDQGTLIDIIAAGLPDFITDRINKEEIVQTKDLFNELGKKFTVFSDHKPLENMNIKSRTDEELGDLTYYLSQYDFQIKYSPGRYNIEADCLSRYPVLEPNENLDEQLKVVNVIKLEDILQNQVKNEKIQCRKEKLISKNNVYYKKVKNKEKNNSL